MKACMLPDYASKPCNGRLLERVGVHNVKVPMVSMMGACVVSQQSMYVELAGKNGIHMSRLVDVLECQANNKIGKDGNLLSLAISTHDAEKAFYEISWEDIVPISTSQLKPTFLFIPMTLEGAILKDHDPEWFLTFKFPYASVCPCSAEMTKSTGNGHPHMQRATASVTIQLNIHFEEVKRLLLSIAEAVALIPVSYMKREDELRWCQLADRVNLFVEDAARTIGDVIDSFSISDWVVVCEHEESIHQHNVVAVCRKGGRLS